MGSQVDFLVFQTELASYMEPVGSDGVLGKMQQFCYFLVRFSFLDKIGNSKLHGG